MKLRTQSLTATGVELQFDNGGDEVITIRCGDARADSASIVRAINSFEALVAALSPFRSDDLGGELVGMIDQRERGGEQAERRLRRLITMIDVILDTVEQRNDEELTLAG